MKQQLCYKCLTAFLIVCVPPVLTCQTSVTMIYGVNSSETFNSHTSLVVKPGYSVEVRCSGNSDYRLLKDGVDIGSPTYSFNVTGEQGDKNETYTCICTKRDVDTTAEIVIQTIIQPSESHIISHTALHVYQVVQYNAYTQCMVHDTNYRPTEMCKSSNDSNAVPMLEPFDLYCALCFIHRATDNSECHDMDGTARTLCSHSL